MRARLRRILRRLRGADTAPLKARIRVLENALNEQKAVLKEKEAELKFHVRRTAAVTSVNAEVIDDFLQGGHVILPKERFEKHLERCLEEGGPEVTARYKARLEETGYRELFEWLFYEEFGIARVFDYKSARPAISFHRGTRDLDTAERMGISFEERHEPKYRATAEVFDEHLAPVLDELTPKRIVEIGGGWGATISYLTERYKPETYHNYEIDRHNAEFTEKRFGAKAIPVDGETLHATESESMDLVIAMNSLFFMPVVKAYSYLHEATRVLRPGGVVLFNVTEYGERSFLRLLEVHFPRRSFSFFPRQLLQGIFPEKRFRDRSEEIKDGYFLYEKL